MTTTSSSATHGAAGHPIVGREQELARLERLINGVSECGAALLVRGEPGIGKSTLLAAAVRYAETAGMRILRATGVQSEAQLPFAGLHQLVDVPTLIVHGDDDQIVPIVASALASSKIVEDATLKIYEGAPHGLAVTHKDQLNEDLLTFLKG
jgi:pimeloyl-ACP methyl ester carboxylesterase